MRTHRLLPAAAVALAASLPIPAAQAEGSVANASSGIADGAPIDYRQELFTGTPVVYYHAERLDLTGQTVRHRRSLEGETMHEAPIEVTRTRQPAWSRLSLQTDRTGNRIVEVVDERGTVQSRSNFAYNPNRGGDALSASCRSAGR
jgi:hypothetical protein